MSKRHDLTPSAHLAHVGMLLFSPAAVEQFRLTDVKYCRFYVDRPRLVIGIELFYDDPNGGMCEDRGGARLGGLRPFYTGRQSAHVGIRQVLNKYGISAAAHVKCPVMAEHFNNMDLIAVDLTPAVHAENRTPDLIRLNDYPFYSPGEIGANN